MFFTRDGSSASTRRVPGHPAGDARVQALVNGQLADISTAP